MTADFKKIGLLRTITGSKNRAKRKGVRYVSYAKVAEPLISAFSIAFTRPTFNRAVMLTLGAILSLRYRTVTGILRAVGPLAPGYWSDFHRVLVAPPVLPAWA
ncbi:MAG: hypothetical protein ACP5VQ_06200 [Phycisphaerae bacterium]